MANAELPRPGVEILQEFRTVSPSIVAPTLVPCVVGVCNQVVEILESDGTLDSEALLSGAAVATAPTAGTYDLDGKTLQLSVNEGLMQTFTFAGNTLTAGQVATQITASSPAPSNFAAYTFTSGASIYLQLRTTGVGEARSIRIVGGTALGDFGWSPGFTYYGIGNYVQDGLTIPQTQLPNPRDNIDELDFDEDSLRVFVDLGTEIREFLRSDTFLRQGSPIAIYDDADGDTSTPYVDLSENLLAAASSASKSTTGIDFSDDGDDIAIHNLNLIMQVDGSGKQTIVFQGQPIVSEDTTGFTWGDLQSVLMNFTVNGSTVPVTFSGALADIDDLVDEINAESLAVAGYNIAYRADVYGTEAPAGDYVGFYVGAVPTTLTVTNASIVIPAQAANTAMIEIFGADTVRTQTNWGEKPAGWPIDDIETQIDNVFGSTIADIDVDVTDNLILTSSSLGTESKIEIDSNSTALTALGLVAPLTVYGNPFPVEAGYAIYGDGGLLGTILEIHAGGTLGRLKLETEVSTADTWSSWYIVAKNLDLIDSTEYGVTYPTPDFVVDTQGQLIIKHDILRDIAGDPVISSSVGTYIAYTALRLDVTPDAANPGMLSFDSVTELDTALGPINTDNPLAYGIFLAMSNAGAVTVSGIGVSEKSADKPYGTVTGFAEVWDFLEAKEVYGIAVLTTDLEVALAAKVHVDSMSEPENKGERIAVVHLGTPTRQSDDIAVSGTDGDRISTGPGVFDTKITTLSQALLDLGIDPTNIATDDNVFIDIASDAYSWNVGGGSAVTDGTKLTINTTFAAGQNDDNFFATGTFPAVISDTFSVKVRGVEVANKQEEIDTIVSKGNAFQDRRIWMEQLDQLRASIDGVESTIPGFYMTAAKVGMIAGNAPQVPFTNYPIAGFTGVTGTNDRYSASLLNQGAAAGAEWIIQEAAGVPVQSRMQVTTDGTSIEVREQSIVKALDYGAKFFRVGLRNFIGRYNITGNFLDTLAAVVQGQIKWLKDHKIFRDGELNNLVQDSTSPDTVLIDVLIEVMYPCNYIRLTMII